MTRVLEDIHEQPAVLERMLRGNRDRTVEAAGRLRERGFGYALIAARGSSDNAARYAQYLWGARNRLTVALAAPSLFAGSRDAPSLEGALVVGISQSGQSPDIVAVVQEARRQGRPTVAITNDPDSPMAVAAESVVELMAGAESVAATKTYTSELLAVALLAAGLADDSVLLSDLGRAPGLISEALALASGHVGRVAEELGGIDRCVVLGRGLHHATAFEWALKLQELCGVVAQPWSTADFEHGPIAVVDEGFPVFAAPTNESPSGADQRDLLARLRTERGARVIWMSERPDDRLGPFRIPIPDVPAWAGPLAAIAGAQLLCHHLATAGGLDPDSPRGLTKITRTR